MQYNNNLNIKSQLDEPVALDKQVFLCYCHKDFDYAQRLLVHLAGCQRIFGFTVWDDSQLHSGSLWKIEVTAALARSRIAILLVSADFLASSFITTFELPYLLSAAQSGGTHILPVILCPCLFEESPLAAFQTVNNPARPLSLFPRNVREQVWVSVVRTLIQTQRTIS